MNYKWLKLLANVAICITVLSISIICLVSMLECIKSFGENQKAFYNAYTEASRTLINFVNKCSESIGYPNNIELDNLNNALTYLESLQIIQKNNTTNDLMSFIYSILSTLLVGLCAGFVVKSKKHADESAKVSLDAQKNAEAARISKEEAEGIRNETQENVTTTQTLKAEAFKQINLHDNNIKILSIHVEIMYARYYLDNHNQVEANRTIYEIQKKVSSLTGTLELSFIKQLRDELLLLKSAVDLFELSINRNNYADNKKSSMKASALRYKRQIDNSVQLCDKAIRSQNNQQ